MREKFSFLSLASVVLALLVPVSTLARPQQTWQGIETSHFAIYTGSPNKDAGRDILNSLETARIFFENSGLAAGTKGPQLNILAFDSVRDADIYRVNPAAYAFYQPTREGDFIVMPDLAPEHVPVAIHEYTHYVVEHAGLKLPLWLNEGLADFYSTVAATRHRPACAPSLMTRSRRRNRNAPAAVLHAGLRCCQTHRHGL